MTYSDIYTPNRAINSATKYPAILTYHELGEKGRLTETVTDFGDQPVEVSEKIDGTNARIIIGGDARWIIGSREDLLTSWGDRIPNAAMGIVDTIADVADRAATKLHRLWRNGVWDVSDLNQELIVLYGEVYGHKGLPNWKPYGTGEGGFRLFDVARIPLGVLHWEVERISSWRQHGGQQFDSVERREHLANEIDIPVVPTRVLCYASQLPKTVAETQRWLHAVSYTTLVGTNPQGRSEGVVLRTTDRKIIRKVRHEDYERTRRANR